MRRSWACLSVFCLFDCLFLVAFVVWGYLLVLVFVFVWERRGVACVREVIISRDTNPRQVFFFYADPSTFFPGSLFTYHAGHSEASVVTLPDETGCRRLMNLGSWGLTVLAKRVADQADWKKSLEDIQVKGSKMR